MTKKLEEEFNLPPIEDIEIPLEDESEEELSMEEVQHQIVQYQGDLTAAERADASLPAVKGLEDLEKDMDAYANEAMGTFHDLCDLGRNVEDRHAAPIFDSASKMLSAALQAKQAKMDKKMKMLELQQRQAKLELEQKKLEFQIEKSKESSGEPQAIEGRIIGDRSTMLADIMEKMKDQDK